MLLQIYIRMTLFSTSTARVNELCYFSNWDKRKANSITSDSTGLILLLRVYRLIPDYLIKLTCQDRVFSLLTFNATSAFFLTQVFASIIIYFFDFLYLLSSILS